MVLLHTTVFYHKKTTLRFCYIAYIMCKSKQLTQHAHLVRWRGLKGKYSWPVILFLRYQYRVLFLVFFLLTMFLFVEICKCFEINSSVTTIPEDLPLHPLIMHRRFLPSSPAEWYARIFDKYLAGVESQARMWQSFEQTLAVWRSFS